LPQRWVTNSSQFVCEVCHADLEVFSVLPQEKQGLLDTLDGVCLFYNHGMPWNFSVIDLPAAHRDLHYFLLKICLNTRHHDPPFVAGYSSLLRNLSKLNIWLIFSVFLIPAPCSPLFPAVAAQCAIKPADL